MVMGPSTTASVLQTPWPMLRSLSCEARLLKLTANFRTSARTVQTWKRCKRPNCIPHTHSLERTIPLPLLRLGCAPRSDGPMKKYGARSSKLNGYSLCASSPRRLICTVECFLCFVSGLNMETMNLAQSCQVRGVGPVNTQS